ncbi:Na+/H+ antiporter [Dyella sp. C11]|uniref:Na+/H+ antiporter n=1 Tax=Dyella sp. C11 TaxID=2126991 RepID=UPI000D65A803|nr:Na+/H+ antiporter [Dyella sp. C11]
MENLALIVLLLAIVVLSSMLARSFAPTVPLPLIQIALGSLVGQVSGLKVQLEPSIFFPLFLAPLLFLDGWRIPREGLFRDARPVMSLAFGLVLFTVLAAGYFIHWLIPTIPLAFSLALAAILSPTDTVAVSSIATYAPVPRHLMLILEGESLLNDASSLVCFRFAIAAALTGSFIWGPAIGTFAWLAVGGPLIGVLVCVGANVAKDWVANRFGEEVGAQILVSLIIPFAAYLFADAVGASGILSAVAAGVMMGIEERAGRASAVTRIRRLAVWDAVQFAGNGVIFVLLGQQLPGIVLGARLAIQQTNRKSELWLVLYVLSICLFLMLVRWLWASATIRRLPPSDDIKAQEPFVSTQRSVAITAFAGARGAVTLAAAMTLPLAMADGTPWPVRDLTILLAAGVIVISLVTANVGLIWLTRPFKRSPRSALDEERELRSSSARAAIIAIERVVREVDEESASRSVYARAAQRLQNHYRRLAEFSSTGDEPSARLSEIRGIEKSLRLTALDAERKELYRVSVLGKQSDELIRRLVYEIDLQESQLCADPRNRTAREPSAHGTGE